MIQKQVDEKLVATHVQSKLLSDKCETCTEFQEKPSDVSYEGVLNVTFKGFLAETEKIEKVGIL